jgi:hypothetical protein
MQNTFAPALTAFLLGHQLKKGTGIRQGGYPSNNTQMQHVEMQNCVSS